MKRVGPRGGGKVGANFLGRGARDFRHAYSQGVSGRSRRRSDVPRRPARATTSSWSARCRRGASTVTTRIPTSVLSSARLGYLLWHYADRPSPDHANARFILLLSAHLESGHYFNPHAQRIIDGKMAGAKLAVMDPRLSNTASMADYWLPTYPGTEAACLLAMAKVILDENRYRRRVREEVDELGRTGSRWLHCARPEFRSRD